MKAAVCGFDVHVSPEALQYLKTTNQLRLPVPFNPPPVCSLNWVYFAAGTVYMEQNTTTSCEIDPVLVLLCVHGRN